MSDHNKLPQFAVIALDAHRLSEQRKADKKKQEMQKSLDHLYESLIAVLGEDANEIITNGVVTMNDEMNGWYLRYQNYGFKADRGYCGDANRFYFTVLILEGDDFISPRAFGWNLVDEPKDIGQVIAQRDEYVEKKEKERQKEQDAIKKTRTGKALIFDAVAGRFQRGNNTYFDDLLYALYVWYDNQTDNSDYQEESDDE